MKLNHIVQGQIKKKARSTHKRMGWSEVMTFPWMWMLHFMGWPVRERGAQKQHQCKCVAVLNTAHVCRPPSRNEQIARKSSSVGPIRRACWLLNTHHPGSGCCTSYMRWRHPLCGQTPLQRRPPSPGALASRRRTRRTAPVHKWMWEGQSTQWVITGTTGFHEYETQGLDGGWCTSVFTILVSGSYVCISNAISDKECWDETTRVCKHKLGVNLNDLLTTISSSVTRGCKLFTVIFVPSKGLVTG